MVEGSISSLGSQYALGLRARNCYSGEVLGEEQKTVARKEDVVSSLSQTAGRLRSRLNDSLPAVERHAPLQEATTPSLEALKELSAAYRLEFTTSELAAVEHYKRAIALDPEFAIAYAYMAHLPVARWGREFLQHGSLEARFLSDWARRGVLLTRVAVLCRVPTS